MSQQPLRIKLGGTVIELSNEFLKAFIVLYLILLGALCVGCHFLSEHKLSSINEQYNNAEADLMSVNSELEQYKDISDATFDEGTEVLMGVNNNKSIYSYFMIIGTEIPRKLWLTKVSLGSSTLIEGQADNIESVYSFFRTIKDFANNPALKLQKLGMASQKSLGDELEDIDEKDIVSDNSNSEKAKPENIGDEKIKEKAKEIGKNGFISSLDASFYEFSIGDVATSSKKEVEDKEGAQNSEEKLQTESQTEPQNPPTESIKGN